MLSHFDTSRFSAKPRKGLSNIYTSSMIHISPAAFASGNKFVSSINNITNISNIHLWMFNNQDVGGSSGIWYTQWLHWEMGFAVKVEPCPSCMPLDCGGRICYFGTCGADNECQCVRGYSGENCTESKY